MSHHSYRAVHVRTHRTKADVRKAHSAMFCLDSLVSWVSFPQKIHLHMRQCADPKYKRTQGPPPFGLLLLTNTFFLPHRSKDDIIAAPTNIIAISKTTLLSIPLIPKYPGQRKDVLLKLIPIVVRETLARPCPCEEHF